MKHLKTINELFRSNDLEGTTLLKKLDQADIKKLIDDETETVYNFDIDGKSYKLEVDWEDEINPKYSIYKDGKKLSVSDYILSKIHRIGYTKTGKES
jgi:hypothetical protein